MQADNMTQPANNSTSSAPPWRFELLILVGLMLVTTLIFWTSRADIIVSAWFYQPHNPHHPWNEGQQPLWQFFYNGAPYITGILLLGSLSVLVFARQATTRVHHLRLYALYLVLLVVVGPGLVINGVFKGYWGRPRPSETQQLGGTQVYHPPLMIGASKMYKSFPAGHSSTGFVYVGFWFIFRQRRRRLAIACLLGSTGFGLLMGAGRIVAGGHFLSDVIWAGLLTYLSAFVLYYFVLQFPQREYRITQRGDAPIPKLGIVKSLAYLTVAAVMVFASLLASPYSEQIHLQVPAQTSAATAAILDYEIDQGELTIEFDSHAPQAVKFEGNADGFGLPTNTVSAVLDDDDNHLIGRVMHHGLYTEFVSHYILRINPDQLKAIRVTLHTGTITVMGELPPVIKQKLQLKVNTGKIIYIPQNL